MKTYHVTAKRWEHGWELHIDGAGVTQSRSVTDAEAMVRDYLRLDGITEPFAVEIDFRAEDDLDAEVRAALDASARAEQSQRDAARKVRWVAGKLRQRNYRGNEVAKLLKVSKQRASQILKEVDRVKR